MSERTPIVICKGTSGLGNRILAACTAILYAEITGSRVYLDWTEGNYAAAGTNAFDLFFECLSPANITELPPGTLESDSVCPAQWQGRLGTSFGELSKAIGASDAELSIDIARTGFTEEVLVFCAYTHRIYRMWNLFSGDYAALKDLEIPEILRFVLNKFLRLKDPTRSLVETYKNENFTPDTIGVHVRYTDMKISVDDIVKQVRRILGRNTRRQIFLATDAQEIVVRFQSEFPGTIVAPKWFPDGGGQLHLKGDYDSFQLGVEALRDLYLLTECSTLVYSSQSSFGRVASLLSGAPLPQIYDIERPPPVDRVKRKVKSMLKGWFRCSEYPVRLAQVRRRPPTAASRA